MVLISSDVECESFEAFDATVCLLYHPGKNLQNGFQSTVHVGSVCRTAIIEKIHNVEVRVTSFTLISQSGVSVIYLKLCGACRTHCLVIRYLCL